MLKLPAPTSNFLAKRPALNSLSSLVGHQHLADETGSIIHLCPAVFPNVILHISCASWMLEQQIQLFQEKP